MRVMYLEGGELVNANKYCTGTYLGLWIVIGVHQGFDGFKDHIKAVKAKYSDISWNQKVTGFKYINHQGTLRFSNRIVGKCLICL